MERNMTITLRQLPKVTVLMPVYDGEQHLREAIDSILGQTFSDFEFLIINDGSTDRSAEIIRTYADPRIRVLDNGRNIGLIETLNKGMRAARAEYIARMDCDDISLPMRLEKQVAFMESRTDVGVCGTWYTVFNGEERHSVEYPLKPERIKCYLFYYPGIAHPTAMMRRSVFIENNLFYDQSFKDAEDYDLWTRAVHYTRLANIPQVLLLYRKSLSQVSHHSRKNQLDSTARVRERQLGLLGIVPTEQEKDMHRFIMSITFEKPAFPFSFVYSWLRRIRNANKRGGVFPQPYFTYMLCRTLVKMILVYIYFALKKQ